MKKLPIALFCAVLLLSLPSLAEGVTRSYYIAADEVAWDFAPGGVNQITGEPFGDDEAFWALPGPQRIGSVYKKAIYREYTDDTFSQLKPRDPQWEHLGILGPLVRANVGDVIRIVFRNNAAFPASVHPHGVFYDKDSEGALYEDGTEGADKADDSVPPGGTHEYTWEVPARAGPGPDDVSSMLWMYHSHTDEVRDVNAGLMGPMLIGTEGQSNADLTPTDVDREFIISFFEFIEVESHYIEENIQTYMTEPETVTLSKDPFGGAALASLDLSKSPSGSPASVSLVESLNGYTYGNLPLLSMHKGERVRWYIMGSTNFEVHAPHWHGNVLKVNGMTTDVMQLLTMGMITGDMVPDSEGIWLFHCHVGGHFQAGMSARYEVLE